MKAILSFIFLVLIGTAFAQNENYFEKNKALRVDYFHSGNYQNEFYAIDELIEEPFWGGSWNFLIDSTGYGEYLIKVFDVASDKLIFSHTFCALFDEWEFTAEAKITSRTFTETFVMPFPKNNVRIEFYSRNNNGVKEKKFEYTVDVHSYFIKKEKRFPFPVKDILISGDPSKKVDIVIIPEGYTADEMKRFEEDCREFGAGLFQYEPFKQNKEKFNIRAVMAPSPESGADEPGENIWKNTLLDCSYFTFDSDRYLMTYNNKMVRNIAANAPYDQIYILVNSSVYGGGSIYNYYSTAVNSNIMASQIFVHEFGHGFAGLADEYDDGSTSYNDLYPLQTEPWEPNITTLVDFGSKWKSMLPADTKIPTPPLTFDATTLGVYEGAGYVAKGIYRPTPDCMMRSFSDKLFCPVCTRAIEKMIDLYTR